MFTMAGWDCRSLSVSSDARLAINSGCVGCRVVLDVRFCVRRVRQALCCTLIFFFFLADANMFGSSIVHHGVFFFFVANLWFPGGLLVCTQPDWICLLLQRDRDARRAWQLLKGVQTSGWGGSSSKPKPAKGKLQTPEKVHGQVIFARNYAVRFPDSIELVPPVQLAWCMFYANLYHLGSSVCRTQP